MHILLHNAVGPFEPLLVAAGKGLFELLQRLCVEAHQYCLLFDELLASPPLRGEEFRQSADGLFEQQRAGLAVGVVEEKEPQLVAAVQAVVLVALKADVGWLSHAALLDADVHLLPGAGLAHWRELTQQVVDFRLGAPTSKPDLLFPVGIIHIILNSNSNNASN